MVVNTAGKPNPSINLAMRCLEVITPVLVLIAGRDNYNSHTNGQKLVVHSNAGGGYVVHYDCRGVKAWTATGTVGGFLWRTFN